MGFVGKQAVEATRFLEVLEAKIEAEESPFKVPFPFLPVACRGLASRLEGEVVPRDFISATERYLEDMQSGTDSSTGKPMPVAVTGMPQAMSAIVRLTIAELVREAFGDDFADTVKDQYKAMTGEQRTT